MIMDVKCAFSNGEMRRDVCNELRYTDSQIGDATVVGKLPAHEMHLKFGPKLHSNRPVLFSEKGVELVDNPKHSCFSKSGSSPNTVRRFTLRR